MPPNCQECPMLVACEQNLEDAQENEMRMLALGRTAVKSVKQASESFFGVFGNTLLFFNNSEGATTEQTMRSDYDIAHDHTIRCKDDLEQVEKVLQYDCPGVKQASGVIRLLAKTRLIDASPACQNPHFSELSYRLKSLLSCRVSWKPYDAA